MLLSLEANSLIDEARRALGICIVAWKWNDVKSHPALSSTGNEVSNIARFVMEMTTIACQPRSYLPVLVNHCCKR